VLWEIKTHRFDTYNAFLRRMTILEELPLLREERDIAVACGSGSPPQYRCHGMQTMITPNSLVLIVYAPSLMDDDGRPLAVVHGIERAFPGVRLEWELTKAGRPRVLTQRERWLAEAALRGEFPLLCNGDEDCLGCSLERGARRWTDGSLNSRRRRSISTLPRTLRCSHARMSASRKLAGA
jgi:hypothetical protein